MGCTSGKSQQQSKDQKKDENGIQQNLVGGKNDQKQQVEQLKQNTIDISVLKNDEDKISFLWSGDLNKQLRLSGQDQIQSLLVQVYRNQKLLRRSLLEQILQKLELKKQTMILNVGEQGKICNNLMQFVFDKTNDLLKYYQMQENEKEQSGNENLNEIREQLIYTFVKTYQVILSLIDPSITPSQRWWQKQKEIQSIEEFQAEVKSIISKLKFADQVTIKIAQLFFKELAERSLKNAEGKAKEEKESQGQKHNKNTELNLIENESKQYLNYLYQNSTQQINEKMFEDADIEDDDLQSNRKHQANKKRKNSRLGAEEQEFGADKEMTFIKQLILQFLKNIPRPFKRIQKKLEIEEEWVQFKDNIRPHKWKIFGVFALISFPFYKDWGMNQGRWILMNVNEALFEQKKPIPVMASSFGKQLLSDIFQDHQIKRDSSIFVADLCKKREILDGVLELLVETIKNQQFQDQGKELGKIIVLDLLKDENVKEELISMLIKALQSQEFLDEVQKLAIWLFSQQKTQNQLSILLSEAIVEENVKKAFSETIIQSLHNVMIDTQTIDKLKQFVLYFAEVQTEQTKSKSLLDLFLDKALKKRNKESQQGELDKFLTK